MNRTEYLLKSKSKYEHLNQKTIRRIKRRKIILIELKDKSIIFATQNINVTEIITKNVQRDFWNQNCFMAKYKKQLEELAKRRPNIRVETM